MFLSIIIPVYNAEDYIEECLESCLMQDIDTHEYEIICVNDGSKDKSLRILNEYAEKNENIIVINQDNAGVSNARNIGISYARGKYIWFVDADDFIKPNCLKKIKKLFADGYDVIDFAAYDFKEEFTEEEKRLLYEDKIKPNKSYWGYVTFHIYKRSFIIDNEILFNEAIKYGEDQVFYHEVFSKTEKILFIEEAMYFYRNNSNSAMANLSKDVNKQRERLESIIMSIDILKQGIENGKYVKFFSYKFLEKRYRLCQECFKRLDLKTAKVYIKMMIDYNLFTVEKLNRYKCPNKYIFVGTYLKQHFKIWKRAYYKRIRTQIKGALPPMVVRFIKWIFRMPE